MSGIRVIEPDKTHRVFQIGGVPAVATISPGEIIDVVSEDAFSGKVTAVSDVPRELAPVPNVNPLTGPIAVDGARPGDVLAVHLLDVSPNQGWGVSTLSRRFGALSSTRNAPSLNEDGPERVWIWTVDEADRTVSTPTPTGETLRVPLRPFLGTLGVAPAHGEIRTSLVPDYFGGNLDVPDLGTGTTIYLRVNAPGGLISLGDGHYAQGDGEFCGTAVEGAMRTRLAVEVLPPDVLSEWPRMETDMELIAIGCGRPVDDAYRVALLSLSEWVADRSGLSLVDSYQLVSQACTARLGNMVNPTYTVAVALSKSLIPARAEETETGPSAHQNLRRLASQPDASGTATAG